MSQKRSETCGTEILRNGGTELIEKRLNYHNEITANVDKFCYRVRINFPIKWSP